MSFEYIFIIIQFLFWLFINTLLFYHLFRYSIIVRALEVEDYYKSYKLGFISKEEFKYFLQELDEILEDIKKDPKKLRTIIHNKIDNTGFVKTVMFYAFLGGIILGSFMFLSYIVSIYLIKYVTALYLHIKLTLMFILTLLAIYLSAIISLVWATRDLIFKPEKSIAFIEKVIEYYKKKIEN